MKKFLSITAILAAFACATTSAFADGITGDSGVSIRVGGVYPTQTSTRNESSNSWFAAGVDYRVGTLSAMHTAGYLSVSVDYTGKGDYSQMPVLLNYTSGKTAYWSVGAGAAFTNFPQDNGGQNNAVRLAYSGAIGYNFHGGEVPLFVELRYLANDQPRVAGVGLYVGARF